MSADVVEVGEGHDEVAAEGDGDASERVEAVPGAAPLLESGDHRLRRPHALRQSALRKAGFGSEVIDQLAQGEILLDLCSGRARNLASPRLHIIPTGVVRHCWSSDHG